MNSTRDRAILLLGQGLGQSTVASTLGVTPSWISQLLAESAVSEEVSRLRSIKVESVLAADDAVETLEAKALKLLGEKMQFARSPMELASIFKTLNGAKRKMPTVGPDSDSGSAQQITITLPAAIKGSINIQLNAQNQVVDIGGQTMAPLPSRALPELAASLATKKLPMAQDVIDKAATQQRLAVADSDRAMDMLDNISSGKSSRDVTVLLGGVECVL